MPAKISEAHIQQAVCEFLILDGWRIFRTELTVQRERGRVVGERGMPDCLAIRYRQGERLDPVSILQSRRTSLDQVMWIEFKAPGKTPRADQHAWHKAEHQRGANVLVVDDIDWFMNYYRTNGMAQRL